MHSVPGKIASTSRITPYLYLIAALQALFFLLMIKSPDYAVLFAGMIALVVVFVRYPEIGLANALTSNILLMVIFDNLDIPIPMPVLLLYLFMVWGGALYYYLDFQEEVKLDLGGPVRVSLLITVLLAVGLLYSTDRSYGIQKFIFFILFNTTLLLAPMVFVRDVGRLENILRLGYYFGLILGIAATSIALATPESERFRPSENVNPIWLARSLGATAVAGLYMIATARRGMAKLVYGLSLFFFLYPIIRSWSRAPMLGLVLVLVLYFLLQPNRSLGKKILISSVMGIGLIIVVLNTASGIAARLQTPLAMEWSTAFRYIGWYSGIVDFLSAPLLGLGTGGFYLEMPYMPFKYPHNLFIELACENGILGLVLAVMFVVAVVRAGLENIRIYYSMGREKLSTLSIFLLVLFVYALWNSMFSGNISGNETVWFAAGLVYAVNLASKRMSSNLS